ncbi:MAG: sigma-54-dependent Fis family transcriptional regulator [Betaproteobacteria bacterium]|nr:sigma-54-dependent Fis family transcriptional regulator [Betaproteobacteria bacterium]
MPSLQVLVVDDEPAIRQMLTLMLMRAGYEVEAAASAEEASARLAKGEFDVALCDIKLPGMNGIELLRRTKAGGSDVVFIMVTAFASMDTAIEALKAGASDYIVKPARNEEILHRLAQIEALRGLKNENRALRNMVLGNRDAWFRFRAPAMLELDRMVTKVAPTDSTVLITGESGTGKGVVARQIHELSSRKDAPFIPVNCGAIPENLLESEFFGHTKGAFTSADRARKGLFLQADSGTIFLDEIGELPLAMQTKLLHVIEDKQVRPIGGEQIRKLDVRIIAATNRDPAEMVAAGKFREDLFYRVGVFQIRVPALRERREDIPELVRFVLARISRSNAAPRKLVIDPVTEELLEAYHWPGNVRELDNVINRAYILADGDAITPGDLSPEVARTPISAAEAGTPVAAKRTLRDQMRRMEGEAILQALQEAGGDRRVAAQKLGIGLSSLYRKLEGIEQERSSSSEEDGRAADG